MSTPLKYVDISSFNGGMNTVKAPYLMHPSESVLLVNVDLRRGAMSSIPAPKKIQDLPDSYFYEFNNHVYSYGIWRSNVEWDRRLYWANGISNGKILSDGTEQSIGLPTPQFTPKVEALEDGTHNGSYRYVYTFYNINTGVESAPSPMSKLTEFVDQKARIYGAEALPQDATHYNIYRIGSYMPMFQRVSTVEDLENSDFIDNLDLTQIDGRILNTLRNAPPPQRISNFTEYGGRLYGSVGNLLYYSALGNPDSWYIFDYLIMRGNITGLAKTQGGLLVMGDDWTDCLRGADVTHFRLNSISTKEGCKSASSIAYMDNFAVWLSNHGIVMSDGYSVKQLTMDKIEDIRGVQPSGAVTSNNIYYLGYRPLLTPSNILFPSEDLYPMKVEGMGLVDQGVASLDFKRGDGFAFKLIDVPNFEFVGMYRGEVAASHRYEEFSEVSQLSFIEKYPTVFTPDETEYSEIQYISPLFVEGSMSTLKEYDKVRIAFEGRFRFRVIFDNEREVVNKWVISDEKTDTMLGIPNDDRFSHSIRFIVEGVGTIYGIQYSVKMRENP